MSLNYLQLELAANQAAQAFRKLGLLAGDRAAFVLENCTEIFPFVWGAQRAGLHFVPVSSRLTSAEITYIVRDSGSRMLLASDYIGAEKLADLTITLRGVALYKIGGESFGWNNWSELRSGCPNTAIKDERLGSDMLYSSGTTGRPKGILRSVDYNTAPDRAPDSFLPLIRDRFCVNEKSIYLCPAPLYHAAPLRWSMWAQKLGATVIVMERFDAEEALRLIEIHAVSHGQFVPTHFIRMLKLEESVRTKFDLSSLTLAIHAAAPCPIPIKRMMIEWWGPILVEYYAGSEANGMTMIDSQEWMSHEGSVGRAILGEVKICNEAGEPVASGTQGIVYFADGNKFVYHNAPEKTAESTNRYGWTTLGDIGNVKDGYLYLTDRKSFMIISGGVNVYPQEIENLLVLHPKVADVAVIGGPDEDLGEKVVAVVQPTCMADAGEALAEELVQYCRKTISGVKVPRQIDFVEALPRADTGKLYKQLVRDWYWHPEQGKTVAP